MTRPMNAARLQVNRLKKLLEFGGGGDRPNKFDLKNVKLIQSFNLDLQSSIEFKERIRHMTCSPLIFCIGAAPTLTISAGAGGRGWEEAALRSE